MLLDGQRPEALEGSGVIKCRFKSMPLLPQHYKVQLVIKDKTAKEFIVNYMDVGTFNVFGDLEDYGYKGEFQNLASNSTPVVIPYEWVLPDGTVAPISLSARRLSPEIS